MRTVSTRRPIRWDDAITAVVAIALLTPLIIALWRAALS